MIGVKILEGIVGSTAYGLNTLESDVDKLGIYLSSIRELLALNAPEWRNQTEVYHNPDITYHEARKFCRLALKCNPSIMELLWLPSDLYTIRTVRGDALINMRELFLSRDAVRNSYLGYAISQSGRMSRSRAAQQEKNARHVYRLLVQGYELYATGHLRVRLEDPDAARDFAKRAMVDECLASDTIATYVAKFDITTSPLPTEPHIQAIGDWLWRTRLYHCKWWEEMA